MNDFNKLEEIIIYKATSPSGKSYVGFSKNFKQRRNNHIRAALNPNDPYHNEAFKRAIRKYEPENIQWEILEKVKGYDVAHKREIALIEELGTYGSGGYNMTKGGDGCSKEFFTKYTQEEILMNAQSYKYKIDWYEQDRNFLLAAKRIDENLNPSFFNQCCAHFVNKPKIPHNKKWTPELVALEAKKYTSKIEMKESGKGAYAVLNSLKKINPPLYIEATSHMRRRRGR